MRSLFTLLLGFVFIAIFVAFFVFHSMLGFVESPDRLVASVEDSKFRDAIVDMAAQYVADEISADTSLVPMSADTLRPYIASVITAQWVEDSLRSVHGSLNTAIGSAGESARFDLRDTKKSLQTSMSGLKNKMLKNCDTLYGAESCADVERISKLILGVEHRAVQAIGEITDEVDLFSSLDGDEKAHAAQFKNGLQRLSTIWLVSLLVMCFLFLFIVSMNSHPWRRLFFVSGLLLLLSGLSYLASVQLGGFFLKESAHQLSGLGRQEEMDIFFVDFGQKLIEGAVSGSSLIVFVVAGAGLLLLLVAQITPKY